LKRKSDVRGNWIRLQWHLSAAAVEQSAKRIADLLRAKYDPDQPRVPAGSREGGRWTTNGGMENWSEGNGGEGDANEGAATAESILRLAPQLAAAGASMNRCIEMCHRLLERFQPRGTININTWDFVRCLNACLGK
jgi:hypothetical protein